MAFWLQALIALAVIAAANAAVILLKVKEQISFDREWETDKNLFDLSLGIAEPEDRQVHARLSFNTTHAHLTLGFWSFYLEFSWTKLR